MVVAGLALVVMVPPKELPKVVQTISILYHRLMGSLGYFYTEIRTLGIEDEQPCEAVSGGVEWNKARCFDTKIDPKADFQADSNDRFDEDRSKKTERGATP